MTGKQLAQEILKRRPDLPIILATGYSEILTEAEAQALGIRRYLMKPFQLRTLQQTIAECLQAQD